MQPPKSSKAFEAFVKLRKQHPRDSKEQLVARRSKLVKSDESLKEAMIADAFQMMTHELYDDAVREGRPIHPALRKPS